MRNKFNPHFLTMIIQSIHRGLDPLGPASKRVIIWFVEEKKNLAIDQIADHASEFVDILKSFLGSGAEILEQRIVKELEASFGISLKQGNLAEALSFLRTYQKEDVSHGNTGNLNTSIFTPRKGID